MKVNREKEEFKPVVITLETPEEVSLFHSMVKVVYYSREILDIINRGFFDDNKIFRFMDELLPKLSSQLKPEEKEK